MLTGAVVEQGQLLDQLLGVIGGGFHGPEARRLLSGRGFEDDGVEAHQGQLVKEVLEKLLRLRLNDDSGPFPPPSGRDERREQPLGQGNELPLGPIGVVDHVNLVQRPIPVPLQELPAHLLDFGEGGHPGHRHAAEKEDLLALAGEVYPAATAQDDELDPLSPLPLGGDEVLGGLQNRGVKPAAEAPLRGYHHHPRRRGPSRLPAKGGGRGQMGYDQGDQLLHLADIALGRLQALEGHPPTAGGDGLQRAHDGPDALDVIQPVPYPLDVFHNP